MNGPCKIAQIYEVVFRGVKFVALFFGRHGYVGRKVQRAFQKSASAVAAEYVLYEFAFLNISVMFVYPVFAALAVGGCAAVKNIRDAYVIVVYRQPYVPRDGVVFARLAVGLPVPVLQFVAQNKKICKGMIVGGRGALVVEVVARKAVVQDYRRQHVQPLWGKLYVGPFKQLARKYGGAEIAVVQKSPLFEYALFKAHAHILFVIAEAQVQPVCEQVVQRGELFVCFQRRAYAPAVFFRYACKIIVVPECHERVGCGAVAPQIFAVIFNLFVGQLKGISRVVEQRRHSPAVQKIPARQGVVFLPVKSQKCRAEYAVVGIYCQA